MSNTNSVDCFKMSNTNSVECFRMLITNSVDCFRMSNTKSVECFRMSNKNNVECFRMSNENNVGWSKNQEWTTPPIGWRECYTFHVVPNGRIGPQFQNFMFLCCFFNLSEGHRKCCLLP